MRINHEQPPHPEFTRVFLINVKKKNPETIQDTSTAKKKKRPLKLIRKI